VRLSTRFRFLDTFDDRSTEEDGPGQLSVLALGVACSKVEVDALAPRGRNVLLVSRGRGVVSISSCSSSEVSGERSDSSSTRQLNGLRSGVTEPANSLSTSSVESAIEDSGVKERDESRIAAYEEPMAGYSP